MKPSHADLDQRDLLEVALKCAKKAGISNLELMFSQTREPKPVHARVLFYRYLRDHDWSYPRIGQFVGKHHSTIIKVLQNWVDE